jgi:hypothetical protein
MFGRPKERKKERPTAYLYTLKTKTLVFIKLKNQYQTIKNIKTVKILLETNIL